MARISDRAPGWAFVLGEFRRGAGGKARDHARRAEGTAKKGCGTASGCVAADGSERQGIAGADHDSDRRQVLGRIGV